MSGWRGVTSRQSGGSFLTAAGCLQENGWDSTQRAVFREAVQVVGILVDDLFNLVTDEPRTVQAQGSS